MNHLLYNGKRSIRLDEKKPLVSAIVVDRRQDCCHRRMTTCANSLITFKERLTCSKKWSSRRHVLTVTPHLQRVHRIRMHNVNCDGHPQHSGGASSAIQAVVL